jgi:hypothetical protein
MTPNGITGLERGKTEIGTEKWRYFIMKRFMIYAPQQMLLG